VLLDTATIPLERAAMGFESLSWSDATFVVCDNVMADIALRQLLTTIIDKYCFVKKDLPSSFKQNNALSPRNQLGNDADGCKFFALIRL
jgi:hypothetical protein